ncbi:MAG: flagellar biosynthesis repressor FlbT [Deltaproteobacteria bacterium]|nr:flagellar biosynthesis repressor FlbT [Deltaproteobacteria bacterium]
MALKIALKPHERLILGGAVVTNGDSRAEFVVENQVPILREKDILGAAEATTPCRRLYFVVQLMYLDDKDLTAHQRRYWTLVHELVAAAPSTLDLIDRMSREILGGRYFRALKVARKLIAYEEELIAHARGTPGSLSRRSEEPELGPRAGGHRPHQGRPQAQRVSE